MPDMENGQLVQSAAARAIPPAGRSVPAHEPAARGQPSEGRPGMAHHGPALVIFWPVVNSQQVLGSDDTQ
jgi:hypothetical protein